MAAIEGGGGWAAQYLEKLVGFLVSEPDPTFESADVHAGRLIGSVKDKWRNDEMRVVSAELALEVVRLRREAEAAGGVTGALVSAWLDQHRDGWRDELPLIVDGDGGRALVDGLMRAVPIKGGSGSIRVSRVLALEENRRDERVKLELEGTIEVAGSRNVFSDLAQTWSRLRLYPSGELARQISGELAIAEADDDGVWRARSATVRHEFDLRFGTAIEAELRGEGQRVYGPFTLPGGDRIGEGLRVYAADTSGEEGIPSRMKLVSAGSGGFRAEPLYLDLPLQWSVAPHTEDSQCIEVHGDGSGRTLWEACGTVLVISDRNDRYLVRSGQKGDKRDTLTLIGDVPHGCGSAVAGLPAFQGAPRMQVSEAPRPRSPGIGEAWWRHKGESAWRPYHGDADPGLIEFAWRDATTGHIRDKKEAIVLPPDFRVERNASGSWLDIIVSGWLGIVEVDHGQPAGAQSWRYAVDGAARSACCLTLSKPHRHEIRLRVPLPHRAWISHWTTGPVARNGIISLSTINQFVARSAGPCELMADLLDRDNRVVQEARASWWVDGELPLATIRDDVAALVRPLGDIDARVKLNFNDSHENYWYVSEFDVKLCRESRGLVPDRALLDDDVQIVGRALADPSKERTDFGAYGLAASLNHQPIQLPPLHGDWLIFLRKEDRVLSRPFFNPGRDLAVQPCAPLGRAMAMRDHADRDRALDELCDAIFAEPASLESMEALRSIIDLVLSLDGLPPSTFDILARVASKPLLGPLLLFNAATVGVEPIMALAEGLLFSWAIVPKAHWDAAAHAQFEVLIAKLPNDLERCADAISRRRRDIAAVDSALQPLLEIAASQLSRREAAQGFLNRSGDRISESEVSPFRPRLSAELPDWGVGAHFQRVLDAPFAAALAALGKVTLNRAEIYCIKDVARRHPRYFKEAFAVAIKEM